MSRRRGISLIELLIVLSACSTLLTISSMFLHRLLREHAQAGVVLAQERDALRLSRQFREDVHAARSAQTDSLPSDLVVQLTWDEEQAVEYRREGSGLTRVLRRGEQTVSREQFRFPATAEIVATQAEAPRRVILVIEGRRAGRRDADSQRLLPSPSDRVSGRLEACLDRRAGSDRNSEEVQP